MIKVKEVIKKFPTYRYRRITAVLGWNRKIVQRVCQKKSWQVKKRIKGKRFRVRGLISVVTRPNERWGTDLTMVWCGCDRWCILAGGINCATREVFGWRLVAQRNTTTTESILEKVLIFRFDSLERLLGKLELQSDNGLVFTSKRYTATARAYGLRQEFVTPYTLRQNSLVERFIRTFKEECIWQHRFESLAQSKDVRLSWISYYVP